MQSPRSLSHGTADLDDMNGDRNTIEAAISRLSWMRTCRWSLTHCKEATLAGGHPSVRCTLQGQKSAVEQGPLATHDGEN